MGECSSLTEPPWYRCQCHKDFEGQYCNQSMQFDTFSVNVVVCTLSLKGRAKIIKIKITCTIEQEHSIMCEKIIFHLFQQFMDLRLTQQKVV